MNTYVLLFDMNPFSGGIGIFLSVAFFLIFAAVAFIAFKLLKKSVKMAFRIVIVAIILAIAVAGSAAFMLLGTSKPVRPQQRTRPFQPN
ncbi:MAG: hypothetical protein KA746_16655 [Pyrinomonadaceae bacterium]|nr:hypothetical protein [Pyrinomonadaceae bacterium]MBP6211902.1 hypothetical protein [Pyrinomonadaceae bacterium]